MFYQDLPSPLVGRITEVDSSNIVANVVRILQKSTSKMPFSSPQQDASSTMPVKMDRDTSSPVKLSSSIPTCFEYLDNSLACPQRAVDNTVDAAADMGVRSAICVKELCFVSNILLWPLVFDACALDACGF
jgi:hypothetical protein